MNLEKRIDAFVRLGERMLADSVSESKSKFYKVVKDANIHNPWFTSENVYYAIDSIAKLWLTRESLNAFVAKYPKGFFAPASSKKVVVIMAGNIPFAGFHDLLCVLMAGHRFLGKVSSKDGHLISSVIDMFVESEPEFKGMIE